MKYHSALNKDIDNLESTPLYRNNWGVAFQHDVTQVLPNEYDKCDVMYSEIAWTGGLTKFNERADTLNTYQEYINGINQILLDHEDIPIYIVAGKKEGKMLNQNYLTIASKLNGAECVVYCYGVLPDMYLHLSSSVLVQADCKQLIIELAKVHNCIGDFCCGYGRAGLIFTQHNKRYVMSDYNGKCITYIKDYYEGIQKS